ncbi:MAG: DUF308 domain-containing protein, partial [Candidatus Babeliales bacterium]|nr:DUF308 domain-containing protein [Candidatus Babeliales bacterium]
GLVALGTLAIVYALSSTVLSVLYLGCLLITAGLFEGIRALKMNRWSGFGLHLFLAVLFIAGGCFMVAYPESNAISLTLLMAFFFIVSGIMRMIFSFAPYLSNRGWLFFNGLVTLLLGVLILTQWPVSGLWVLGMFMGVEMLSTGCTWIVFSLAAKELMV